MTPYQSRVPAPGSAVVKPCFVTVIFGSTRRPTMRSKCVAAPARAHRTVAVAGPA